MSWLPTEAKVRAAIERQRAEAWRQALRVDDGPQTILVAPGDVPRRQLHQATRWQRLVAWVKGMVR